MNIIELFDPRKVAEEVRAEINRGFRIEVNPTLSPNPTDILLWVGQRKITVHDLEWLNFILYCWHDWRTAEENETRYLFAQLAKKWLGTACYDGCAYGICGLSGSLCGGCCGCLGGCIADYELEQIAEQR
jgi:hypothetical protein